MKLCSFATDAAPAAGVVVGETVVDVSAVAGRVDPTLPATVLGWVERGDDAVALLGKLVDEAQPQDVAALADVRLLAPIPDLRRSAICVAANYRDHVMEAVAAAAKRGKTIDPEPYLRAEPSYFTKDPRAICGPFDDIEIDLAFSEQADWEVELAVVIGKVGEDVSEADAPDHVFGFATFNDLSVRDIQSGRGQMWKGKNLRRASAFGPYIVTKDEIDPTDLALRTWVSGDLLQDGRTSAMIHGLPKLVSDLSHGFRLEPGDVIATGTTTGTGSAQDPPRFLRPGDVLETEIEGLGRQVNHIV